MSLPAIEQQVNVRRGRLEAMLKVLEVEGAVERERRASGRCTGAPWEYDAERVERVTAERRAEQQAMDDYAHGDRCLMQFLRAELDDPEAEPCGRCAVCTEPRFADAGPARARARGASSSSAARPVTFEPRKRWIGARRGQRQERASGPRPGRALSYANDPGWGRRVVAQREAGALRRRPRRGAPRKLVERWPTGSDAG